MLILLSCLGRTARPGLAKEDVSSHGLNSEDDGAAEPTDGERGKVERAGGRWLVLRPPCCAWREEGPW